MQKWDSFVIEELLPTVEDDLLWYEYLKSATYDNISPVGIHLAVFNEPYLTYVLNGQKTVESRFALKKIAPFKQISSGDILLLKKSSGPILGLCKVSEVWFYDLSPNLLEDIRADFAQALCAQDPAFWEQRNHAAYATLLLITCVKCITPIRYPKKDRRGWVVLKSRNYNLSLF
ncbi:MAG: ASCH domain-containing protein [Bellilinea sp.]